MDDRITTLKEKQQVLGDKITMIRETNKKKDEEAEKIRELIAECRENLNRIKCDAMHPSRQQEGQPARKNPCSPRSDSGQPPRGRGKCSPSGTRQPSPCPCATADLPSEARSSRNDSKQSPCATRQPPPSPKTDCPSDTHSSPTGSTRLSPCSTRQASPCQKMDCPSDTRSSRNGSKLSPCLTRQESPCAKYRSSFEPGQLGEDRRPQGDCGCRKEDPCAKYRTAVSPAKQEEPCPGLVDSVKSNSERDPCESATSKIASQISALSDVREKSRRCIDKLGERLEREVKMKITSVNNSGCPPCAAYAGKIFDTSECEKGDDAQFQERVSCQVDLNNMKVNIRGPPEDLKKLDAVQLINLLDKFQCQELVINTGGSEAQQVDDAQFQDLGGEIPVFYVTHPGNIVLVIGVVMVAFLVNANLCNPGSGCRTKFLLNMLYLGSFAFHYGIVLWMSFIRGLTLSAGLSRETFNAVDNLVLPKYFSICVFLSAITLYSFLATHCAPPCSSWPPSVLVQVVIESITFLMELIAICYVVPAIIKIREAIDEVANEEDNCPPPESYCRNVDKLTRLNWTVTFINTISVMFMGSNMYYLSSKLNIG